MNICKTCAWFRRDDTGGSGMCCAPLPFWAKQGLIPGVSDQAVRRVNEKHGEKCPSWELAYDQGK